MKQLYEQVRMDTEIRLFYIQCPICNKRKYGNVAPFLCWGKKRLERCEQGKAFKLCQLRYNHAKAQSVQHLSRYFNQCRKCLCWVCDECYDLENCEGACVGCTEET